MAKPKDRDREDLVIEDDDIVEEQAPAQGGEGLSLALLIITTGCLLTAIILNLYHLRHTYQAGIMS